jgi:polar amino acid transport system permease protein
MNDLIQDYAALAPGLVNAAQLAIFSIALAYPLGFVLALLVDSRIKILRVIALVIVEVGRGLPLLVILYLIYRGLPQVDVFLDPMPAAVIGFTWSVGAYATEMLRSSLHAIPPGQTEAAKAVGFSSRDALRFILLPQAARIAIPALMNLAIKAFQLTSLAYAITLPEVMQAAYLRGSTTFQYLQTFVVAASLYAVIAISAAQLVRLLERRLSRHV